jgi:DNA adenine methylase
MRGQGEMGGMVVAAPTRPLVRYHGGKWRLAPWIITHFPPHRVYVEPFGGGGSVLLRKPRSYGEVYNDLDDEIVNLFRVARDHGPELLRALELTPFARTEFVLSYEPDADPVEQARRTVARSFMGFGSAAVCGESSGFRANSNRSGTTPAHDWRNYPEALVAVIDRLRGVVIEHRDAIAVMRHHDAVTTLHYVDPPYVHSTRSTKMRGTGNGKAYRHELDDAAHAALAECLHSLQGGVVLSGYRCDLYDALYRDWRRIDKSSFADGARARVESLWLNAHAEQAMAQQRLIA